MPTRGKDAATTPDGGWIDFRLGYQAPFDGLRGFAVISVMIFHGQLSYHGRATFLPGTYLGVEIFFVQSGFLITSLLLDEWFRTGGLRLGYFYARRALRLLPALFAVIAVTALWLLTFSTYKGYEPAWREVWASVVYAQNWFNALKPNLPFYLNHVWSLSIEEQFYLVVPPLMLLALWRGVAPRRLAYIAGALALASAGWMAYLGYNATTPLDLGRIFYGTDTRGQGLLVGVTLACVLHSSRFLRTKRSARMANVWGWAGVIAMIYLLLEVGFNERSSYYGMFLLCGIAVAGMLSSTVANPRALLARGLRWEPLRYTGQISYGLYLWHWPLMLITRQYLHTPIALTILLQIIATFPVAMISYYFLERPIIRRFSGRFPRVTAEREARHAQARASASTALA